MSIIVRPLGMGALKLKGGRKAGNDMKHLGGEGRSEAGVEWTASEAMGIRVQYSRLS